MSGPRQPMSGAKRLAVELVGHHASLPLAFAILYQDYPFALADIFLKRTLALLGTVTLAFIAVTAFGAGLAEFAGFLQDEPRLAGTLVTVWVGTALLYPSLRRVTSWFVDRVILHRPDYRAPGRPRSEVVAAPAGAGWANGVAV